MEVDVVEECRRIEVYEMKMFAVTCSGEWPKRVVCISAGPLLLFFLFSSTLLLFVHPRSFSSILYLYTMPFLILA